MIRRQINLLRRSAGRPGPQRPKSCTRAFHSSLPWRLSTRWAGTSRAPLATLALALSIHTAAASITTTIYVNRQFEIRDHDQPTKYVFNGATRVAQITGSLSTSYRVQRLRLYAGWNLCSLAVSGSFPASAAGTLLSAYQWRPESGSYSQVTLGQTLAAGTVLWLEASSNSLVTVLGSYTDPTPQQVPAGSSYLPGQGLEEWPLSLPGSVSSWVFDAASGKWSTSLANGLAAAPQPPPTLAPGEAFYVDTDGPTVLDGPDPALRIRYYHQDHLGSSAIITDSSGSVVEETAFFPFGVPREETDFRQLHNPYQFTQKERDSESSLNYFEARYLVAGLSRFIRADPKYVNPDALAAAELNSLLFSPQRFNLYAYCSDNPLRYTDPTGLGPWRWFRDNVWIPGVDPVSELDVARTAKVGGGLALAFSTGGGSLIVQGGVLLVASDQIVSGVTGNESYVHKGGAALCGGNQTCGTVAETALTLGAGGYNAAVRLSGVRLGASGVVATDAAADSGIIRVGAGRTAAAEVKGGGGVFARTAAPIELEATAQAPVAAGARTFASESGEICRVESATQAAANEELNTFYRIMREQQAALRASGTTPGSELVNKAFENADSIWRSTYGTKPPGSL